MNLLLRVAPCPFPVPHHACITATLLLALAALPAGAQDGGESQQPPPDYSLCRTCDVRSGDDPEVLHFAGMIAETRWSMERRDSGVMVIKNDAGDEGHWRWTAEEGVLQALEPVNEPH